MAKLAHVFLILDQMTWTAKGNYVVNILSRFKMVSRKPFSILPTSIFSGSVTSFGGLACPQYLLIIVTLKSIKSLNLSKERIFQVATYRMIIIH